MLRHVVRLRAYPGTEHAYRSSFSDILTTLVEVMLGAAKARVASPTEDSTVLSAPGIAIGTATALAISRVIRSMLIGYSVHGPGYGRDHDSRASWYRRSRDWVALRAPSRRDRRGATNEPRLNRSDHTRYAPVQANARGHT